MLSKDKISVVVAYVSGLWLSPIGESGFSSG